MNEPDIIFREAVLGEDIRVNGYKRLVCMRYWNEVYIPYETYEKAAAAGMVECKDSFVSSCF